MFARGGRRHSARILEMYKMVACPNKRLDDECDHRKNIGEDDELYNRSMRRQRIREPRNASEGAESRCLNCDKESSDSPEQPHGSISVGDCWRVVQCPVSRL